MFYILTIVVPLSIFGLAYLLSSKKPKKLFEWVNLAAKSLPYYIGYTFIIYYLEMENIFETGWVFYTLLFFLFPLGILIGLLKLIHWYRTTKS